MSDSLPPPTGRLIYLAGPSGSGKDTLIRHAARAGCHNVVFARRWVTRPAAGRDDPDMSIPEAEFLQRLHAGRFALDWEANSIRYGIDCGIDAHLLGGRHVVVNGSRAYLPVALRHYPELRLVWVTASADRLRTRLGLRQRESADDIERRLVRAAAFGTPPVEPHLVVRNDGDVAVAGGEFTGWLATLDRAGSLLATS